VEWMVVPSSTEFKKGDVITIVFGAQIIDGWYLYASDFDPEVGPLLTTITFDHHASFELVDALESIAPIRKHDKVWGGEVAYFIGIGTFFQKIRILDPENFSLQANVRFQVCSEVTGQCIVAEEQFGLGKNKR